MKQINIILFTLFSLSVGAVFSADESTAAPREQSHAAGTVEDSHANLEAADSEHAVEQMERELPFWSSLPFAGMLLSIALLPLLAPHFWHHHFPKISAAWAIVFAVPFLIIYKQLAVYEILHIYLVDYIPFIILLWGLYTVSGGILLRGSLVGTPLLNLQLIVVGTLLASWMGTTGASMLMIRPLLRANASRKSKTHVIIFFIFLVSNIGGALTPLGDPPLFLGFLHGVPFFWTFTLIPHFLFTSFIILIIFFILDSWLYRRQGIQPVGEHVDVEHKYPLRLEGVHNFLYLGGILGAVLMSGNWKAGHFDIYGVHLFYQNLLRDLIIVAMGLMSLASTHKLVRRDNEFNWFPIKEVAYLFAGIFMTIIPMLAMLRAGTHGAMAGLVSVVSEPHHYFWITGMLSSFLDNAPTYLTFFSLSLGKLGISEADAFHFLRGVFDGRSELAGLFARDLTAISAGAVFFGAVTYIGNAPNFMVRSIAMQSGAKMPSFFGYMMWSIAILVPVFLVVTLMFF